MTWGGAHLREVELKLNKSGVESSKSGANIDLLASGRTSPMALGGGGCTCTQCNPAYALVDTLNIEAELHKNENAKFTRIPLKILLMKYHQNTFVLAIIGYVQVLAF